MHGQGVFATERIPAGTLVCVYRGEPISSEEADRRSRARPPGAPVFIFEIDEDRCIDATDTGTENPARFINHACEENCEAAWNPRERRLEIRALRDLAAGEELSIDYGFGLAGFFEHPCRCGKKGCRGSREKVRAHRSREEKIRSPKEKERRSRRAGSLPQIIP